MMKALVIKELRETAWIAAIGLVLYLALLSDLTGRGPLVGTGFLRRLGSPGSEIPFLGSTFTQSFAIISALLALALGFRQSMVESGQGTYLFLLHRPWSRTAMFLIKLAVGGTLILICAAVPIVLYSVWAATPGNVPAPFEWSMTYKAWWIWGTMPVLYLGAFLCGLRSASWYGTRLLPLIAAATALFFLHVAPWQWGLGMVSLALVYALLIPTVCYVARTRDYS